MAAENNVPDCGCSEEHLVMRTCETILLTGGTDIWNMDKQPLLHSDLYDAGHNCPHGLY